LKSHLVRLSEISRLEFRIAVNIQDFGDVTPSQLAWRNVRKNSSVYKL